MQMTHKHDVYFSPHSTEAHNLVMQIADYCNKRGIWYKIYGSTLGIGIEYGSNVAYVIDADRKTSNSSEFPNNCKPTGYNLSPVDKDINVRSKDEQTDCNGCKFVGTYDTEFPCANCSRKTKDYYAKDEPQAERRE